MSNPEMNVEQRFEQRPKNVNTSGQGPNEKVPAEVAKKFNWGAFLWGWIWGVCNGAWITLIGLAIPIVICIIGASMSSKSLGSFRIISNIICFPLAIWFGVMGNKWAWQNKRYNSIHEFHEKQKRWVKFWFMIFGGLFLLGILAVFLLPLLIHNSALLQH